jgi:hypothetical protein
MIKFFRNIRQKMLTENKFSKYLLYAFGEIILVVIGILIALSINNWNQKQVAIKKETLALNNLILDLEEQSNLLKEYTKDESYFYENGLDVLRHFAKHKAFTNKDSILPKLNSLASRRTFNPINTTFKELVSTGNIGLIRNETLKRNIMRHYNELERVVLITSYNNTNIVDGLFNPVLLEQTLFTNDNVYPDVKVMDHQIFDLESLKDLSLTSEKLLLTKEKSLHLFNVLQFRILVANAQIQRYNLLQQEITELLNAIKLETEQE